MKIALLSNINIEPLRNFLKQDFEHVYTAGFNQYVQELTTGNSVLNTERFDVIFLHLDGSELLKKYLNKLKDPADVIAEMEDTIDFLSSAIEQHAGGHLGCTFIVNTVCVTPYRINNLLEHNAHYSVREVQDWLNRKFSVFAQQFPNILVMDWEKVVTMYGYNNLYDDRFWYIGRIKYNTFAFEKLAEELRLLLKAYRGRIKKVLVLDLDNTLWGGIIGEDGIEGIQLSEEGTGKAFLDFQKTLKDTKDLGIILALCSKNNMEDVKECFDKHPMSVLSLDDFVSMKVNWTDKVTNMKELSAELNLGLDSFVFLDDNPVERELIKQNLPDVSVPDFPGDPAELPNWFVKNVIFEYFPKIFITDEDKMKTAQYKASMGRKKVHETLDLNSFIKTLDIRLKLYVNDKRFIDRTAQMTQKTNQFNLTTKRYTKQDINNFIHSTDQYVFNMEYGDRFGNEGIVCTVIIKVHKANAYIDSLLMSCRVIGRKIEFKLLNDIVMYLHQINKNIDTLYAKYIPTKKNVLVADFYEEAGFLVKEESEDGIKHYERDITSFLQALENRADMRVFQ
ncbi:HAD-IIIC family phosphatase [bacterium]|nr:MAG: HAD-IIIC family phosphatase [bacterium]